MAAEFYCTACGSVGRPRMENKGSTAVELILYCCAIIPGLIYSFWRMANKERLCAICRAPNPIPLGSPLAQRALQNHPTLHATYGSYAAPVSTLVSMRRGHREVGWLLATGIVIAPYIFGWALARPGYSNATRAMAAVWGALIVIPLLAGAIQGSAEPPHQGTLKVAAQLLHPKALDIALLGYGALGKPNPNGDDGAPTDSELQKRSPQSILDEFRKRERELEDGTVAQSTVSGHLRDDEIAEYEDVQRVLFYNVVFRAPHLITSSDLQIVRADEQYLYEDSCGDRGSSEAAYELTAQQCAPYESAEAKRTKALASQQQADAAKNKQWDAMLDGNKITCGTTPDGRWFIIWPDENQKELGERPIANNDPSDDAWQSYCGTGAIVKSW